MAQFRLPLLQPSGRGSSIAAVSCMALSWGTIAAIPERRCGWVSDRAAFLIDDQLPREKCADGCRIYSLERWTFASSDTAVKAGAAKGDGQICQPGEAEETEDALPHRSNDLERPSRSPPVVEVEEAAVTSSRPMTRATMVAQSLSARGRVLLKRVLRQSSHAIRWSLLLQYMPLSGNSARRLYLHRARPDTIIATSASGAACASCHHERCR